MREKLAAERGTEPDMDESQEIQQTDPRHAGQDMQPPKQGLDEVVAINQHGPVVSHPVAV